MIRPYWHRLRHRFHITQRLASHARRPTAYSQSPRLEGLEDRLTPATHLWTGAAGAGDLTWSNPTNWNGGVPTSGEAGGTILIFPATATALKATTDDLTSLAADQIIFQDSGYTVSGTNNNSLTLTGSMSPSVLDLTGGTTFGQTLHVDLTAAVTIEVDAQGEVLASFLSGAGGLTKMGAGTLTLSQFGNGYGGATQVNAGTLQAGLNDAFPHGTAVTVASGATLDLNNFQGQFGSLTGSGSVILGANADATLTVGGNGVSTTFSGAITGAGGSSALVKTGPETLTLSGSNRYTGQTWIQSGTLQLGVPNALPTGTDVDLISPNSPSPGTLDLNGFDLTINNLTGGTETTAGGILLGGGTLTVGYGTYGEPISGSGGLIKAGSGTLILTGNQTYTGPTTISGGTLQVDGTLTASSVTVASGAVLRGSGTVGQVMLAGTIMPGYHIDFFNPPLPPNSMNSPGVLHTGPLTFQAGSNYGVVVNSATAYGQLPVSGTADLEASPTLIVMGGYAVLPGTSLTIVSATDSVTGTFQGLPEGAVFSAGRFRIHYTSNAVILERIATPSERFVSQVYLDLLGRSVDSAGLASWSGQIDQGTPRSQVVLGIEQSLEYRMDLVDRLYATFLHRAPDPTGMNGFLGMFTVGGTVEQAEASISGSPEYFQMRGGGTTDGFLDALYHDALGRAVDPTGRAGFDQAFTAGATPGAVAGVIFTSDEYRADLVQGWYQQYLHRPADTAGLESFVSALRQGTRDEAALAAIVGSDEYFAKLPAGV
jgi:autotransporter-associated beta strand protein